MSVLDEAIRLNATGQREAAVRLVERAAGGGDAEALFALANWRLFGLHGARDLAAAHGLFDRALAAGSVEAVRTKAILTANGTGCQANGEEAERLLRGIRGSDPHAALQLDFLADMPPASQFPPDGARMLSETPVVKLYPGLLAARECAYLTAMAEPNLQPSFVTNPQTGARMPHPIRTSMGTSFGPTQEDLVIRRLNERIAHASGTRVECGEPLHMLRYTSGQEYKPHTDSMPGEANQREWTVLVYLNEGYEGGATRFPRLDLEVKGAPGDALIFCNVTSAGQPDPASLHAGLPVTGGAKWLATRWIRARPFTPG